MTHYFGHLSVAAVTLTEPLALGERIHIREHTSNVERRACMSWRLSFWLSYSPGAVQGVPRSGVYR